MATSEVRRTVTVPESRPRAGAGWVWLVVAAAFMLAANGRNTVPLAAWLAPVFLVRFARSHRVRALPLLFVVISAAWVFQFRGMVPMPLLFVVATASVDGLLGTIMYGLDRWLARRLGGLMGTLVLPATWAAMEFVSARWGIFGSWSAVGYTQYGILPLVQIVSITGLYGIGFLITWFATVVNWAWEQGFSWPKIRRVVLTYAVLLVAVLLYGGWRLSRAPESASVRVASVSRSATDNDYFPNPGVARRALRNQPLTAAEIEEIRQRMRHFNDELLARADSEAAAGAKIVFWGESNATVFKEDEPELIQRGRELARNRKIYLGMAIGSWQRGAPKPLENKIVLIDPAGTVLWEFWKAHPVPGSEAAVSALGDGLIKVSDTPYGRIGAAICFDADFPELLKQAGRQHADIILNPSNDWRAITPWHAQMATFRAIEQGFNLVRHTSRGMSLAVDYTGRVHSAMDDFTSMDHTMVAQVPTAGVRTIYSRFGDWFGWLSLAGLVALVLAGARRRGN